MKYIIYILIAFLLNSCGNAPIISEKPSSGVETNTGAINNTTEKYGYKHLNTLQLDIDNTSIEEINKELFTVFQERDKYLYNVFQRPEIELIIESGNIISLEKLQETFLIKSLFNYNLTIKVNSFEDSKSLYNFIKYINRNTSIYQIKIEIDDQNLKINEKLFTEILQNSRFRYSLNLDFSDDFKEIDILTKIHGSNIQALGFNDYRRGVYFDNYYFRGITNDTVYFTHKGKRAEFDIIDGEEVFTYFEGPGSERIPFEYGE